LVICLDHSYEYAYDTTTLYSDAKDTAKTKLFEHGNVDIYVSMSASSNAFDADKVTIGYPASKDWMDNLDAKYKCQSDDNESWLAPMPGGANCKKFYENGVI